MEGHKLKAKKGTLRIDLASFGLADLGLQKNGNFPPHFSSRNSPMSYQEKLKRLKKTMYGYSGTVAETDLKYTRDFSNFRLSYERQI